MSHSPPPSSSPLRGSGRPDQSAIPMLPRVDGPQTAPLPQQLPPGYNPLKVPASIIIRKDQVRRPGRVSRGEQYGVVHVTSTGLVSARL